ncbi:hypothetical protein C1H46_032353 [Malus baccata]|uniref:Uncharacterized protein n=1 Tax=Malus baccata TaxID=106549 RepID=A0A540L6K2_MALBA|nr:hypothetical protein C1H46_032353 [Malus baccata]
MSQILNDGHQAARGLLALREDSHRLRALDSLWTVRPGEPTVSYHLISIDTYITEGVNVKKFRA